MLKQIRIWHSGVLRNLCVASDVREHERRIGRFGRTQKQIVVLQIVLLRRPRNHGASLRASTCWLASQTSYKPFDAFGFHRRFNDGGARYQLDDYEAICDLKRLGQTCRSRRRRAQFVDEVAASEGLTARRAEAAIEAATARITAAMQAASADLPAAEVTP